MPLQAGERYESGVIVGRHYPPNSAISGHSAGLTQAILLDPVVEVLREHHGFDASIRVNHKMYRNYGAFRNGQESPSILAHARGQGLVLRVFYGFGHVKVNGRTPIAQPGLDYGDWLYIPPGVSCKLTGAIVSGMNLQFGVAALVRRG